MYRLQLRTYLCTHLEGFVGLSRRIRQLRHMAERFDVVTFAVMFVSRVLGTLVLPNAWMIKLWREMSLNAKWISAAGPLNRRTPHFSQGRNNPSYHLLCVLLPVSVCLSGSVFLFVCLSPVFRQLGFVLHTLALGNLSELRQRLWIGWCLSLTYFSHAVNHLPVSLNLKCALLRFFLYLMFCQPDFVYLTWIAPLTWRSALE